MEKTLLTTDKPVFSTEAIKKIMSESGLGAMDLVRLCGVSVASAYKIDKSQPLTDLNVIYKVYQGLQRAGFDITWEQITGIQ